MKKFTEILESALTEAAKKFKIGQIVYHKDFDNGKTPLTIVKIHDDNKLYNTVHGVSGISVRPEGTKNTFGLWFDTETLRIKKKSGLKSDAYKKLIIK